MTLWHHVYDTERLRESFLGLGRKAAPGVDGVTWLGYRENLEENIQDLSARLKRGAYRAKPVKRVYIPKADGRQRPIGIASLEDKIVQRATADVLNAVYETDFLGFSYGFRPGRNQHMALDALAVGIQRRKVSWVLDADIRGFFDAIDRKWLMRFVEHRIMDKRVRRQLEKWLNAGVLEDGRTMQSEGGTPQGASLSPLLANIYLHYVLDLWAHAWRRKRARGDVIIVRYADDVVMGFQYASDAKRFLAELHERLAKFNLELHPEKTRLIEFGRFAAANRRKRGMGRPETFTFLGFVHVCDKTRKGKFVVLRKTMKTRMRGSLQKVKQWLRTHIHDPVPMVGAFLQRVITGHLRYYAVPRNGAALNEYRFAVGWLWYRSLQRRSQKTRLTWERFTRLTDRYLPHTKILHPYPEARLERLIRGRSPVR